jgi:y4mF family transcriptional regulator
MPLILPFGKKKHSLPIAWEKQMEITDIQALGKAIRQQRKAMGLTQLDAAGLCGVGERYLSELERGKESASLGKAMQVMNRLGLKLEVRSQHLLESMSDDHA